MMSVIVPDIYLIDNLASVVGIIINHHGFPSTKFAMLCALPDAVYCQINFVNCFCGHKGQRRALLLMSQTHALANSIEL